MGVEANTVVIEDLVFDSPQASSATAPRGILPNGSNVTVRRCLFDSLGDAMSASCTGWLTIDNTANQLGGYFAWSVGSDHTHLGNVTNGSINEHMFRLAGVTRANLSYNNLYNQDKTNIWCMLGSDVYAAHNTFRTGRIVMGPNYANTYSSERFRRVVLDGNKFVGTGVVMYHGAENIIIRNNVIEDNSSDAISIWGYSSQYNRTNDDVRLFNNTFINFGNQYGKVMQIGAGTTRLQVMNNLHYAPYLNTAYAMSNVSSSDSNLNTHTFRSNLWATPHNGSHVHGLGGTAYSVTAWNNLPQTISESYRYFNVGDLNASFVPQFAVNQVTSVTGVFTDFNGNYRPSSGYWAYGAIDPNATPGGGTSRSRSMVRC
jgi:hypothetical protein